MRPYLLADDPASRLDERLEAVGDRAAADADGADLDQLACPGVAAGGLGIEDDEGLAAVDRFDEVHDRTDRGLDVGHLLDLADLLSQLLLERDDRLEALVREHDGVGHDRLVLRHFPCLAGSGRMAAGGPDAQCQQHEKYSC